MTEDSSESTESLNQDAPSAHSPSEPSDEQKKEISKWVAEGIGLSDIQKKINKIYEHRFQEVFYTYPVQFRMFLLKILFDFSTLSNLYNRIVLCFHQW